MGASDLAVDILLGVAVALELACCLGLVVMRDAFDRLHYAAAATTLPPALIAAAVFVVHRFTQPSLDALAVAVLLGLLNPALVNATARVLRARRR